MSISKAAYLYRFLSFRHVVDLFETGLLHFSSPSAWDDPYEQILQHPKSNRFFAQCWCKKAQSDAMWRIYSNDRTSLRVRTTRQALRTLADWRQRYALSVTEREPRAFKYFLREWNAALRGVAASKFRDGEISTVPDRNGGVWVYPDAASAATMVERLHEFLRGGRVLSPLARATVAHAVIAWAHPFPDGNGRLSRNIMLQELFAGGLPADCSIPFKAIFDASRAGYLIRMRQTVLTNDWADLLVFMANAVLAFSAYQKALMQGRR